MGRRVLPVLLVLMAVTGCNSPTPSPAPSASPATSASAPPEASAAPSSAAPSTAASPTSAPASGGPTGDSPPRLTIQPFVTGLQDPVDIGWRPDDPSSLFIVEQAGRIRIVRDGKLVERPFLDVTGLVRSGGEQGLLGLAFLPSAENGRFFIYYTDQNARQVVASYDTDPADRDVAAPATAQIWLRMADSFPNHNGGSMVFGPDGNLYIGTGDGGGGGDPSARGDISTRCLRRSCASTSRVPGSWRSRLQDPGRQPVRRQMPMQDPRSSTPGSAIRGGSASIVPTGDLWIGDVGQGDARGDRRRAQAGVGGLDFGWNFMEGTACYPPGSNDCADPDLTLPVTDYGHDLGCSVTGGTVYRGDGPPALVGWYVFSDYCSGESGRSIVEGPRRRTDDRRAEPSRRSARSPKTTGGELVATDCRERASCCRSSVPRGLTRGFMRPVVTVTVTAISLEPASTGVGASAASTIRSAFMRGPGGRGGALDDVGRRRRSSARRPRRGRRPGPGLGHCQKARLALGRDGVGDPERQGVQAGRPGPERAIDDVAEASQIADRHLDDVRELVTGQAGGLSSR